MARMTTYPAQTLSIEGPDAIAFAQSQFSSNLDTLAVGQWQFSAWLDAQGRVRTLFHLARLDNDRLLLLLRGGDAATMAGALQRFVFRSKVRIEAMPVRALGTGPSMPTHVVSDEPGALMLGCGDHSLRIDESGKGDDAWRGRHIRAGWPWLPDNALGELLPPTLSLARLQAVAMDKGCYPGQEIVARLHYRGGNKRHMHCVVLSQALPPGALLRGREPEQVRLLDTATTEDGHEALAILHDTLSEQAMRGPLEIDNTSLRIRTNWSA
jgi:folate-binding protein YgfZ